MAGETYSTEGPQCPHCQRQITADDSFYYDEIGYTEETCGGCGKKFSVEVSHTVAWLCDVIESDTVEQSSD